MSDAHEDHHPHPHDGETVVEPPQPDPYYEALNDERRAEADQAVEFMQQLQVAYDQNLVAVLGEGVFQLGRFMLTQQARILHLEQRIEELESKHQRHYHDGGNLAMGT